MIWAVSFLLFPIGSWFFLYDKKMSLKERAEARGVRPPGYFSQELYLYVWIEISLCVFAVGGMMFCFDEHGIFSWVRSCCFSSVVASRRVSCFTS